MINITTSVLEPESAPALDINEGRNGRGLQSRQVERGHHEAGSGEAGQVRKRSRCEGVDSVRLIENMIDSFRDECVKGRDCLGVSGENIIRLEHCRGVKTDRNGEGRELLSMLGEAWIREGCPIEFLSKVLFDRKDCFCSNGHFLVEHTKGMCSKDKLLPKLERLHKILEEDKEFEVSSASDCGVNDVPESLGVAFSVENDARVAPRIRSLSAFRHSNSRSSSPSSGDSLRFHK